MVTIFRNIVDGVKGHIWLLNRSDGMVSVVVSASRHIIEHTKSTLRVDLPAAGGPDLARAGSGNVLIFDNECKCIVRLEAPIAFGCACGYFGVCV